MELNHQVVTAPPRHAASVILLRDHGARLQVFMLKRHGLSDVLGGAFVFPGGKLDPDDCSGDVQARLDTAAGLLHEALGEPELDASMACGLWVAACRETFEEARILMAAGAAAGDVEQAIGLARDGLAFSEILRRLELTLQLSALAPWSRWITPRVPSMQNKRFDTRFFVAQIPDGLDARHDDHEATDSLWAAPREILERYWRGDIALAPPQIMSLAHLSRHGDVGSVLREARSRRPPLVQPEPFQEDGRRVIAYPGDARHPVRERALPGPTRLAFRNDRFEPVDGFDAFFA